jgi:hypothetical protein
MINQKILNKVITKNVIWFIYSILNLAKQIPKPDLSSKKDGQKGMLFI